MPACWPSTSSRTSLLAGCFPLRALGSLRDSGKRFWFCSWVVLQWNSSFEICKKWEHLVLIVNCGFKESEELFCPETERVNNLVTSFQTFDIWRLIHRINHRISIFKGNKFRYLLVRDLSIGPQWNFQKNVNHAFKTTLLNC